MRKSARKAIIIALVLIIACVGFAGCGNTSGNSKKVRTVRINCNATYTAATFQLIKNNGLLDQYLPEGVTIEWTSIGSAPDIRDAILTGNLDISDMAALSFIIAQDKNIPLTMISACGMTPIMIYSNNDEIQSLDEIRADSKIAITNKTTTLHSAFLATCKEELGDALIFDNNLCAVPAADALASLSSSSDYDLAIFSFPNYAKADKLDNLTLIKDMTPYIEKYGDGALVVTSDEFYKTNKDVVEAFRKAQEDALKMIEADIEGVATQLADIYGIDSYLVLDALNLLPPSKYVDGYDEQGTLLFEAGLLSSEPQKLSDLDNYNELPRR